MKYSLPDIKNQQYVLSHGAMSSEGTISFTVCGKEVIISRIDYERVIEHKWYFWDEYLHNEKVGYLHTFIMGERPDDVPKSHVIDHKNRKPLDNSQPNLRYVSKSFNSWNVMTQHRSSSRFKGVFQVKATKKWRAMFLKKYLGYFDDERSAAKAVAKAVVKEWPIAIDSDLLVGEDLLSADEMQQIQKEIDSDVPHAVRELPKGVSYCTRDRVFLTQYKGKNLGSFATASAAKAVYDEYGREKEEQDWEDHRSCSVTVDTNGSAIIALSGNRGEGQFALVPNQLWHQLTYRHKWNLSPKGYAKGRWDGKSTALHVVIYSLLHPGYDKKLTVDHRNSEAKLDDRETNLRLATLSVQNSNKIKKANCSSIHIGIHCNTRKQWFGTFLFEKVRYTTRIFKSEEEALLALRAKEVEVKGVYARS